VGQCTSVIVGQRNSKWRRPPSWIYYFCPFSSNGLFSVTAVYISAKFRSSTQSAAELLLFGKNSKWWPPPNICVIFWHACMFDLKRNIHAKFCANACNNKQLMSDKLNLKWRLNLLFLFILVKRSISGSSSLHFCKISFIYVNRRPSYCCLCKNPRRRPPPSWILFLFNIVAYLHVGPPG